MQRKTHTCSKEPHILTLYHLVEAICELVSTRFAADPRAAARHMRAVGAAARLLVRLLERHPLAIRTHEIRQLNPERLTRLLAPAMSPHDRAECHRLLQLLISHARAFHRTSRLAALQSLWRGLTLLRSYRKHRWERDQPRRARSNPRNNPKAGLPSPLPQLRFHQKRSPYLARQNLNHFKPMLAAIATAGLVTQFIT